MSEHPSNFNTAARGTPSSVHQIKELEKQRIKPTRQLELKPQGAEWRYTLEQEAARMNQNINEQQAAMRQRMARKRSHAKTAMNEAANRRSSKDRRGKDHGR